MPNEELVKLLSDADILCDELFLHGPGVLSAEAMAAGCAVATRCLNIKPFQPPVCSITPENISEKLKLLITDIDYRTSLAKAAKIFVDEFNSPNFLQKDN
ncbi:MAG: glycosyltransferase [Chitinophagaceae bacterium]|nr:glycosyltransferase [Chitinophagaceae bacterium]